MFAATLFDYNGLLVDDEHVHLASFQAVLSPLGIELDERAYWERYLGFDDAGAFRAILTDHGHEPSAERIAELIEAKRPRYLERARSGLRVFPGAAERVKASAAQGPVAIVSGALRSEIELGLSVLGVSDLVGQIIAAEDAPASKPDPLGYQLGVEWVKRTAGETAAQRIVAYEDSLAGIEAAKAAQLTCIAVPNSYPRERLEAAGADWVVGALTEVDAQGLKALFERTHGPA